MIEVKLDSNTRHRAYKEAREIGVLPGCLTGWRAAYIGAAGEIVANMIIGGERVGHIHFSHDIALPNGMKVDVKSGMANTRPLPHYVARIYAPECQRETLGTKCDAYYFMRVHGHWHTVWALGWMLAEDFAKHASFHPKNSKNPADGRKAHADEFTVPISMLRNPRELITR